MKRLQKNEYSKDHSGSTEKEDLRGALTQINQLLYFHVGLTHYKSGWEDA